MTFRSVLLLASATCAFVAAIANSGWGWFGIEHSQQTYQGAIAVAAMLFALSFLDWGRLRERYHR